MELTYQVQVQMNPLGDGTENSNFHILISGGVTFCQLGYFSVNGEGCLEQRLESPFFWERLKKRNNLYRGDFYWYLTEISLVNLVQFFGFEFRRIHRQTQTDK